MRPREPRRLNPDERRERRRGCSRKRRFRDPEGAKRALHRLSSQSGRETVPVRYYGPCSFCKGYHLTSREMR